jgi:hypothetical protein
VSPSKRVQRALRGLGRIEDDAARAQLRLLRELRRGVLAALGDSAGFRVWQLNQILQAIDREIFRFRPKAEQLARASTQDVFILATSMVDDVAAVVGRTGLAGFSAPLLDAAIFVTTDQVTAVWGELGSKLKHAVKRTAFGIDDPFRSMQALARVIKDPKTFGSVMNRAEAIIRTEVNRTFSVATDKRMRQSNQRLGGGLKKWWLTAEDSRVRDDHVEAGEVYGRKGTIGPIPVDQPYIVGGEKLMFPRDPNGSAKQTIQCRCHSVPSVEDIPLPAAA